MIQKRDEIDQHNVLEGLIIGDQVIDRINLEFQTWIQLKNLLKELGPISCERNTDAKIALEALKSHHIPLGKYWRSVAKYHKIIFPHKG